MGVLQRHLAAVMPFQSSDGRWRQLVNDTDSFLETSCTAMFTSAIARSIMNNWIDASGRKAYVAAAMKVSMELLCREWRKQAKPNALPST